MDETTTVETTTPDKEDAMSKKKTTKPKPATPKASKTAKPKSKAVKQPKVAKPKGPKPDRTFAIRITGDELEAIHKAAGPRNATRFVRSVAAAFAAEDEAAFRSVLKEAREARG